MKAGLESMHGITSNSLTELEQLLPDLCLTDFDVLMKALGID